MNRGCCYGSGNSIFGIVKKMWMTGKHVPGRCASGVPGLCRAVLETIAIAAATAYCDIDLH